MSVLFFAPYCILRSHVFLVPLATVKVEPMAELIWFPALASTIHSWLSRGYLWFVICDLEACLVDLRSSSQRNKWMAWCLNMILIITVVIRENSTHTLLFRLEVQIVFFDMKFSFDSLLRKRMYFFVLWELFTDRKTAFCHFPKCWGYM